MSRVRLASRSVPHRSAHATVLPPHKRIITPLAPEFTIAPIQDMVRASWASGAWFSANDPIAVPFVLSEPCTVVELGWVNGTSAGGNVDIGIYDSSFNRLVSAGSTAAGSSNAWGWANVTDTPLASGRYYLVHVRDNITANRLTWYAVLNQPLMAFLGCMDSTTDAFPLPNPLTNMVAAVTATRVPAMAMAVTRAHL